jgi:hypothetical protein
MPEPRWPDWMKRETVAAYADLRPGVVDQYVKRGLLPTPRKLGEALLWSREEVDKAIRGGDGNADSTVDSDPYLERIANAEKILNEGRTPSACALRPS